MQRSHLTHKSGVCASPQVCQEINLLLAVGREEILHMSLQHLVHTVCAQLLCDDVCLQVKMYLGEFGFVMQPTYPHPDPTLLIKML